MLNMRIVEWDKKPVGLITKII